MTDSELDRVYDERNRLVAAFVAAVGKCWIVPSEDGDPDWFIVFCEPSMGLQMSWHIPAALRYLFVESEPGRSGKHPAWDGHTTEEKYQRLENYTLAEMWR